jgi:hypothetical protein
VWEHADLRCDASGRAAAAVRSAGLGVDATVTWDGEVLPRCFQWVYPTTRGWALGIEPANAPLFGPDREGAHAGAPLLEPGAHLDSGFALTLSDADADAARPFPHVGGR